MGFEKKRRVKDVFKDFGYSNWKGGVFLIEMEEIVDGVGL